MLHEWEVLISTFPRSDVGVRIVSATLVPTVESTTEFIGTGVDTSAVRARAKAVSEAVERAVVADVLSVADTMVHLSDDPRLDLLLLPRSITDLIRGEQLCDGRAVVARSLHGKAAELLPACLTFTPYDGGCAAESTTSGAAAHPRRAAAVEHAICELYEHDHLVRWCLDAALDGKRHTWPIIRWGSPRVRKLSALSRRLGFMPVASAVQERGGLPSVVCLGVGRSGGTTLRIQVASAAGRTWDDAVARGLLDLCKVMLMVSWRASSEEVSPGSLTLEVLPGDVAEVIWYLANGRDPGRVGSTPEPDVGAKGVVARFFVYDFHHPLADALGRSVVRVATPDLQPLFLAGQTPRVHRDRLEVVASGRLDLLAAFQ